MSVGDARTLEVVDLLSVRGGALHEYGRPGEEQRSQMGCGS